MGELLRAILPYLIAEGKKPKDVKPAGYDPDLQNDIDSSIESSQGLARCKYCGKVIERFDCKCCNK